MEKKPDLTSNKNIFNWVVYTLATVVGVLYFSKDSAKDETKEIQGEQLKKCQEENEAYAAYNRRLLDKAYNLKNEKDSIQNESKAKDTVINKSAEIFDSIAVKTLKEKTSSYLKTVKNISK